MPPGIKGLSLIFLTSEPPGEVLKYAMRAEALNFHSFWLGEAYYWFRNAGGDARSSTSLAAVIANRTKRIAVGLSIINPYTRHPALIAMEAATLDEISNGRIIVGLGAAKAGTMYLGDLDSSPVQTFRETITIMRALLSGSLVEFQGKKFRVRSPPTVKQSYRANLPIVLGATGPKLIQLAGELADGLITASISTPRFLEYATQNLKVGANKSGRALADFLLGAVLICAVSNDGDAARDAVRIMTATYLANKVQNIRNKTILDCAGFTFEELKPISDAIADRNIERSFELANDDVLTRAHVIAGTPAECVSKLKEFAEVGLDIPLLEVPANRAEETMDLLAREVGPELVSSDSQ